MSPYENLRQKLNRFLNLLSVQGIVVGLVVLDVLLVTFLLLIELDIIQAPVDETRTMMRRSANNTHTKPPDRVQEAEHIMHIAEIIVLVLFLVEIILRVLGRGVDLIYDKWQVFDCLVVVVTFVLYISLTAAVTSRQVTYSVGYLILPRLWRIGRIHYDLTQPVIQKARSLILAHRRAWRDTDEQLKQTRQRADRQQEKIEVLKARLTILQSDGDRQLHSPTFSNGTRSSDDDNITHNDTPGEPATLSEVQLNPSSLFHNLRSRSLPTTTPREYFETDSSMSLPGSPKSLSCCQGNQLMSYGSSGKIPDLVEHTQGADVYRDPSFKDALNLQALALDSGGKNKKVHRRKVISASVDNSPHKSDAEFWTSRNKGHSKSDDVLQNFDNSEETLEVGINGGPKYKKNPDRNSTGRNLSQHHREKSASTGALTGSPLHVSVNINGASSQINCDEENYQSLTLPRIRKDGISSHDGKHYPKGKGDRVQLLKESTPTRGSTDYAFSNPSFTPEELEKIEREEIERVSQIPFDQYGSISHLLREGIPISEL